MLILQCGHAHYRLSINPKDFANDAQCSSPPPIPHLEQDHGRERISTVPTSPRQQVPIHESNSTHLQLPTYKDCGNPPSTIHDTAQQTLQRCNDMSPSIFVQSVERTSTEAETVSRSAREYTTTTPNPRLLNTNMYLACIS
jgi:hypothetical protein